MSNLTSYRSVLKWAQGTDFSLLTCILFFLVDFIRSFVNIFILPLSILLCMKKWSKSSRRKKKSFFCDSCVVQLHWSTNSSYILTRSNGNKTSEWMRETDRECEETGTVLFLLVHNRPQINTNRIKTSECCFSSTFL